MCSIGAVGHRGWTSVGIDSPRGLWGSGNDEHSCATHVLHRMRYVTRIYFTIDETLRVYMCETLPPIGMFPYVGIGRGV